MANKTRHLIDAYQRLQQQSENCVLATIIETSGSTYQKAGARMLITKEGELLGLLGGGCFERDLVEQARPVFETGVARTVFYDMRASEEVIWGLGLGCNGAVRIFLQLLEAERDFSPLNRIADAAETNVPGVLVTVYESSHADFRSGYSLFLPETTDGNPSLLASHSEAIQTAIDLGTVATIVNPDWQEGMSSSIRAGVQTLPASAAAVLILLCDQPLINTTLLQSLLEALQHAPSRIVASQYHHSVGVPALFPAEFFPHLLALKGDKGAKSILMQFENSLLKIPMPEAELDIDCADDFDCLTVNYLVK